ncbi:hypothetical protein ABZ619_08695 [Streptomyces sp. NPDC007851]|uniref:hypothetical protein n=1 Tax=Streptomyces sp. NPDC007851 TaxID=3155008 RepID=UPI0033CA4D09
MRSPITLAAALAAMFLAGGCVSVGSEGGRPHVHPAPVAVRAASHARTEPTQASARTALVETAQDAAPARRPAKHRKATSRQDAEAVPAPLRPAPRQAERQPRRPRRLSAPRHRALPRRAVPRRAPHRHGGSPAQPGPTYDMRTVCGWSDGVVTPSVRSLCDTYTH